MSFTRQGGKRQGGKYQGGFEESRDRMILGLLIRGRIRKGNVEKSRYIKQYINNRAYSKNNVAGGGFMLRAGTPAVSDLADNNNQL